MFGNSTFQKLMEGSRTEGDDLIEDYVECLMSLETNSRPGDDGHTTNNTTLVVQGEIPVTTDGMPVKIPSEMMMIMQNNNDKDIILHGNAGEEVKLEPVCGMEFESDESAKNFYNDYARRLGFPFRVGRSRRSKGVQEVLIMKRFVCSKEGIYRKKVSGEGVRKRERISMREGCKAFMEVIRDKDRWIVSKLETAHTHVLGTCSRAGYLRARGFIDTSEKATIVASDATTLLRQNAFGEGGDAQGLLDYFKKSQADNPSFFYAVQVDNNSCVTNAFWADAKARVTYNNFGEAVTFDTTYKKNKYMMPFVTFSGINHHLQPVIFGCALLIDETEFSFIWLFETWLAAMGGRAPISLTSDQNRAMASAIAKVFPNTRHRFCKWLILSRTKQKLAHAYAAHPNLREELEKCVVESKTIRSFETTWVGIIDKYDLRKNPWLQALFNIRNLWIPLYLADTFFADLSPLQKLETVNDLYKKYFNTKTSLKVFLTQFELAMAGRYDNEIQADNEMWCDAIKPLLKTASPIEKQASEVYTLAAFQKFQEEFLESLGYNAFKIKDQPPITKYNVVKDEEDSLDAYIVTLDMSRRMATCSCNKFEFGGILCRHILGVFLMIDLHVIPEEYILRRWTKNAKNGLLQDEFVEDIQNPFLSQSSNVTRYNDLCRDAIRLSDKGSSSVELYKITKEALQKAFAEIVAAEKNVAVSCAEQHDTININEDISIDEATATATTDQGSLQDPQRKLQVLTKS